MVFVSECAVFLTRIVSLIIYPFLTIALNGRLFQKVK